MTGTEAIAKSAEKSRRPDEASTQVHDEPGEEEVERRAAALGLNRLEQPDQRLAPDEQRQRLVLVRRPRGQACDEEDRDRSREPADSGPEQFPAGLDRRDRVGAGVGRRPGRRHLTRLRRQGREASTRSAV